jgi:hypothetical protein
MYEGKRHIEHYQSKKRNKRKKARGNEAANWWIITSLILVFPLVLLAGLLG